MLEFFRKSLKSRVGALVGIGVLVLIALAFASADVAGTGSFGGIAGGDRVATVGKTRISSSDLSKGATLALENMKQENPRLSMQGFLAADGLGKVLDDMIARAAVAEFGRRHGIVASDRLIDSEIAKMAAFRGPDGNFSESLFRQTMQQRGVSEAMVRSDLAQGLIGRQVLVPASLGAVVPQTLAERYAALLRETRKGAVAMLPSAAFAPKDLPDEKQLAAFYASRRDRFIRPERRIVRYAVFTDAVLKETAAPTDAEVAARYNARKDQYAARETRRLMQLVLPTEAAAQAVAAEAAKGTSLDAAARAKGLSTATIGPVDKAVFARQTSQAVADAAFAAARGALTAPVRGSLGWYVLRIDAVETSPGKTLAQARAELAAEIVAARRRSALSDMTARIEDEFDNGGNLADAARELGVKLAETPQITADGQVYGKPGEQAPPALARVLQTAFAMERENEPQIAEVEAGKQFVIFDVTDIAPSAPAPLAEIRQDVQALYMLDKGFAAAKSAARQLQAAVDKGSTLTAAVGALRTRLPPVQQVDMSRAQLAAAGNQVPPPLMLLFSMAQGTVKTLPGENEQGWFVVALDKIETQAIKPGDPVLAAARKELSRIAGDEYALQLRAAIRADVGVERNETAIRAVRQQLGGNGAN